MKAVIGIIPGVKRDDNNPYEFKYIFLNSYSKMIVKCGAIPYGLLLNDEEVLEEQLNSCDGFLFPGGKKLEKAHFDIIMHAIKYNKPILGICLGMQVLNFFGILKDILIKRKMIVNKTNLWNLFNEVQNEEYFKLKDIPTPNINGYEIMKDIKECNYNTLKESIHDINIDNNSILFDIYKTNKRSVLSLHLKQVTNVGSDFKVSARAKDNIIESLEYKDKSHFILGVQYHPELDDDKIFKYFIKEVLKRNV